MAIRWKTPEINPALVDPAGVASYRQQQAMGNSYAGAGASDAMRGYQPNVQPNYRGMAPTQATQMSNAGIAEQNYNQFMQESAQMDSKRQQLEQLKARLNEIDKEIAAIQASGADEERSIAAKLAEIGDTSVYQGILAREQNRDAQSKSSASGIDNMLFEADKLSWGLNSKSDEDRNMVRQNIRAVLDRASEIASQTGARLPEKYFALRDKLEGSDNAERRYMSDRARANEWWDKARSKTLTDQDLEEARAFIRNNPNSDTATQLRPLIEQYSPKTVESRAAASKRKADAQAAARVLMDLSLDEQLRRWSNMTNSERKLLNDHGYIMDPKKGITSKEGI